MSKISFDSESGAILLMVIIFMLALTIVGLAFLNAGVMENKLARREVYKNQAFWLADGGIEHLWVKLSVLGGHQEIRDKDEVGGGSDGDYQPAVWGTADYWRLALGEGGYWVEYYEGTGIPYAISIGQVIKDGSIYDIPDVGKVIELGDIKAQRKIRIELLESSLFDYLIFGDEWIKVGGSSSVAYVPGTEKGKVGTNGTTDDAFTVFGGAEVIADVYIVDDADKIIDGIDGIDGEVSVGPPIDWPAVTEPNGLTFVPTPLNILPSDDISLSESWEYPSIDVKGILRIPAGARVKLLTDTLEILGGGEIIIEDDGVNPAHLEIYVREYAKLGGHGITNVGQDPTQCQIYGIGESTIDFNGTEDFYGTMYAPDGDITTRGDAKIQGSVIGNTVDINGNPMIWWDPALGTGDSTKTSLINWQEIFQ